MEPPVALRCTALEPPACHLHATGKKVCSSHAHVCKETCSGKKCDVYKVNTPKAQVQEIAAAEPDAVQTCLSFRRRLCPPLNISAFEVAEQRATAGGDPEAKHGQSNQP